MPNYCTNRFKVNGPAKSVAAVKELITNNEKQASWWNGEEGPMLMDFDRIVPQPPNIKDENECQKTEANGMPAWWNWRLGNWGTKWEAWDFSESMDKPGVYAIYFITAWSCPLPIYEALAERFKDCTFTEWNWIEGNDGQKTTWKWNAKTESLDIIEGKVREDRRFQRLIEGRML